MTKNYQRTIQYRKNRNDNKNSSQELKDWVDFLFKSLSDYQCNNSFGSLITTVTPFQYLAILIQEKTVNIVAAAWFAFW